MSSPPFVSIILCAFNRGYIIERAIRSVLRQTFRDWELIIVDDGSWDDTRERVAPFLKRDSRIRYFHQRNTGLARARNAGIRKARGEFVTFLDSDDEYKRDHLQKRASYTSKHSNVDLIHGGLQLIGPTKNHSVADVERPGRRIHLRKCFVSGTFFVKRSVIIAAKGFRDLPFGEDFDMIRRIKNKRTIRRVYWRTYIYHTEGENRICTMYEKGGARAIKKFRAQTRRGLRL